MKMEEIVRKLNAAADAYYNSGTEIMSNFEYDSLYDQLVQMEEETGVILPDSPTQRPGYEASGKLPKVVHEFPALSLDKTKDTSLFKKVFDVRDKKAVIMWKMDGSTVVAEYKKGKLTQLVTRGNGEVGEDITHNAPYIKGLPMEIPYKGRLVVRGEAIMTYSEFNRINDSLPEDKDPYQNPRNLANSTVSIYTKKAMDGREIWFHAFTLVYKSDDMPFTFLARLQQLELYGFNVVEHQIVTMDQMDAMIDIWTNAVSSIDFPVDGLVVAANDAEYAELQPGTEKHPDRLAGFALKWEDTEAETTLRNIEWSASRTGLLNPVAVFDPVDLEGTTVTRASVSNLSEVERLNLHVGDTISVIKANKIIPKVIGNKTAKEYETEHGYSLAKMQPITVCPVCGLETTIKKSEESTTKTLWCKNQGCAAKHVGKFVHFCERDCMNVEGLSEATIEKFVDKGWLKEFADLYHLDQHRDGIVTMEGFGQKSYDNIITAVEKSRQTSFVPFIHALGINNIGKGQAKLLNKVYDGDIMKFFDDIYMRKGFQSIEGFGEVLENSLWNWGNEYLRWIPWENDSYCPDCDTSIMKLLKEISFKQEPQKEVKSTLEGKTFVITGSVEHFTNRDELKDFIESNGGKTSGSVSKNTSYLINNDVTSTSGKNKKAMELGVEIISEQQFLDMVQ